MDETTIERAARALERQRTSGYEWTDAQFEIWFNRDPFFNEQVTSWPDGFRGTRKQHLFFEVKTVLEAANKALQDRIDVLEAAAKKALAECVDLIATPAGDALEEALGISDPYGQG